MIERIWRRLRKLGVVVAEINIDPDGDEIWSLNEVAAEWMLLTPQRAVDINRAYEQVYPGALTSATGLPISTLVNEQRWIAALTSPTPAEKLGGWLRQLAARSD